MFGSKFSRIETALACAFASGLCAKYSTSGTTVTLDLEDSKPALVCDLASLSPDVQREISLFGLRTLMRNATAGKIEDLSDGKARAAVEQRLATFASGKFTSEAESKAKAELSEDERNDVIRNVIVMAKRAKGDTRDAPTILTAFNALPDAQKSTILATLQKVIDKQMKAKLREKKQTAKSVSSATGMDF